MHLILTGATGLVGSGVLNQMLKSAAVTKVSVISRRPVPMADGHAKANVIIHKDFSTYDPTVLEQLRGAQGCVFALGISVSEVSKDEYWKITIDFPLAAAKAFATLANPFRFVYVSGEGATTKPGAFTPHFGSVKGEAEAALLSLSKNTPSLKIYSIRPGGVDPSGDVDIHPFIPSYSGFMKKYLEPALLPVFRTTYPGMISPTEHLGRACVDLASGDGAPKDDKGVSGEGRTLSNVALRRLVGI